MAQVLPPDEERAKVYQTKNFNEVKCLLSDGSVVDALPVDINMVVGGTATAENQTNGNQKTQVVDSSGTMGSNAVPFSVDLKGLTFSTGLTLAITGANSNATVIYE